MASNIGGIFIGISLLINLILIILNSKETSMVRRNEDVIMEIYRSLDKSIIDLTKAHCDLLEDYQKEIENLKKKVDLMEQSVYNDT